MRLAKVLLLAALMTGGAAASNVMHFTVDGKNPDGTAYKGTVSVTELPASGVGQGDRFTVIWDTGDGKVTGIGAVASGDRKTLAVAIVYDGAPGIVLMVEEGGSASGVWAMQGGPGMGTETWTALPPR